MILGKYPSTLWQKMVDQYTVFCYNLDVLTNSIFFQPVMQLRKATYVRN